MIRRLWHALVIGHSWRVVSVLFCKPIDPNAVSTIVGFGLSNDAQMFSVHGFTEVVMSCRCGASKTRRPIGDHSGISSAAELDTLERMAK